MKTKSIKKSLNFLDLLKGLLIATLTSGAMIIQQVLDSGNIDSINWKSVAMAAIGGGLSYLLKNMVNNLIIKKEI